MINEPPPEVKAAAANWRPLLDHLDYATKLRILQAIRHVDNSTTPEVVSLFCALLQDAEIERALNSLS